MRRFFLSAEAGKQVLNPGISRPLEYLVPEKLTTRIPGPRELPFRISGPREMTTLKEKMLLCGLL